MPSGMAGIRNAKCTSKKKKKKVPNEYLKRMEFWIKKNHS